jgi:hypothetical protein
MLEETPDEIKLRLADRAFGRPLIENTLRSLWVEAMIEPYLGRTGWKYVGADWNGWDFERGRQRLELKQSAATQTWWFETGKLTKPQFDIRQRTGYYEKGAEWVPVAGRPAQVYVFAWNGTVPYNPPNERDAHPVDHRDPLQWEFYVVPECYLPTEATTKTMGLSSVRMLAPVDRVGVDRLAAVIDQAVSPSQGR